jgi:hypothetical protein
MHPDPEVDATLIGYFGVAFGHAPLYGKRAFDRIDHAGELHERAITHQLDDTAVVVSDSGVDQLVPMALERA